MHGRDAGKAVLIIIVLAGQKLEQKYDFIEDSVRPGREKRCEDDRSVWFEMVKTCYIRFSKVIPFLSLGDR